VGPHVVSSGCGSVVTGRRNDGWRDAATGASGLRSFDVRVSNATFRPGCKMERAGREAAHAFDGADCHYCRNGAAADPAAR
jgi:hypothetical protein